MNCELIYSKIDAAFSLGKYQLAIKLAEKILSQNTNEAEAYNCISSAQAELGNINVAESYIKKALSISPNEVKYLKTYCEIYLLKKEYDNCIELANKILLFDPQDEITLNNYGYFIINNDVTHNNLSKALEFFKSSLRIKPTNKDVIENYDKCIEAIKIQNKRFNIMFKSFKKYEKFINLVLTIFQVFGLLLLYSVILPKQLDILLIFLITHSIFQTYRSLKTVLNKTLNKN